MRKYVEWRVKPLQALVTGGAGYIGSHLTEQLLKRGYKVTVIDNCSRGNTANLSEVLHHPRLTFVQGDIRDSALVAGLMDNSDIVYHLAAVVGVKHYVENPVHVIETNVNGTKHVLECANQKKVKVVFASTSEIYGKNALVPFDEQSDRVLGSTDIDRWCYSTSKAIDEHLCFAYHRLGLPVTIVRYFNSYGPRADMTEYGGVVVRFIHQALQSEPITVHHDGSQTRSFTFVSDTVLGTILAGESNQSAGRVYNIGNNRETSIRSLAETIKAITGSQSAIQYIPYEQFYGKHYEDIGRRVPSITRATRELGWKPRVGLKKGLQICCAYYAQRRSS